MAPLPPNNTARFRFFYTTLGFQHSLQVRSNASPAALGAIIGGYFDTFNLACEDIAVDFVDWAPAGSDIFNPVVTGIEGTVYPGGPGIAEQAPWTYSFVGRTSGGRRVRFTQFGALFLGGDYRFEPGFSAPLDNVRAVLVAAGSNILGIDGIAPVWRAYANAGVNDHYMKRLRG